MTRGEAVTMKKTLKYTVPAVLAFALVFALAGCGASPTDAIRPADGVQPPPVAEPGSAVAAVEISDFAFSPETVEIDAGATVTWTNLDTETHTVVGDGGIGSDELQQDGEYSKTFPTPGSYSYRCSIHPAMEGTVIVK